MREEGCFRVARHTRADRGNFMLHVTELRPRDCLLALRYPFSQKAIRYQHSTNLTRAIICPHVVSSIFSIRCHSYVDLALRSMRGIDNRSSREPLSARPNHHLLRSFDITGICENKVPRRNVFRCL